MKRRSSVQKNRMVFCNFFKNIPNLCIASFKHSSCRFKRRIFLRYKFFYDKWLKKFQSHILWKPTLIKFQVRTNDNNASSRIINSFSKQVLSETSLLSFKSVRQRFKHPITRSCHWSCS